MASKYCFHEQAAHDPSEAADEMVRQLKELPWSVTAVIPGAETGVLLADQLATQLDVRNNGLKLSFARRNKYDMGETVRAAGVRAARQHCGHTWDDIESFLEDLKPSPFLCVAKPIQSAGSDDVIKCTSVAEVKGAFDKINGAVNGLGVINEGILVQEYLEGAEYVVDSVSRDGVHKVTAIWEYDKRSVNGANFVYFGMTLLPATGPLAEALAAYSDEVLDALEIHNGPGHMEVKMCNGGPCLVEVGSRCHGGEGSWRAVALECVGYDQIECTLDAYLDSKAFEQLPKKPAVLQAHGCEVFLVARQSGVVRSLPGKVLCANLASYRGAEWQAKPGSFSSATIDCFTRPGAVQLAHVDAEQLKADVATIRDHESKGHLLDFEVVCATAPPAGCVVVVGHEAIIASDEYACLLLFAINESRFKDFLRLNLIGA
jgi:biotin carboxylase